MQEFSPEHGGEAAPESDGGEAALVLPIGPVTLAGEEFYPLREISGDALLEWSELGIAGSDDVDIDSPEGVSFLARFLRATLGIPEYQRLRRHVRAHRVTPGAVMALVAELQQAMAEAVEQMTGRPTGPSSPSSGGDGAQDALPARVVSLSRGLVDWREPTAAERAMGEEPAQVPPALRGKTGKTGKAKAAGGGSG